MFAPVAKSKDEARERWSAAEDAYRATVEKHLSSESSKLTKSDAIAIASARTKADRRMDEYFRRSLGEKSPRS